MPSTRVTLDAGNGEAGTLPVRSPELLPPREAPLLMAKIGIAGAMLVALAVGPLIRLWARLL